MKLILVAACFVSVVLAFDLRNIDKAHEISPRHRASLPGAPVLADPREIETSYWIDSAQATLASKLGKQLNKNKAKNVIFFIGDGLSIPTLAASRIYLGQQHGKPGEENVLSFEKFPYTGLAKTYCVDSQVPDSACTATAYLSGVKGNDGTGGVNGEVNYGDCPSSMDPSTHVDAISRWFQQAGKKAGYVTTTRVTHASPAPLFGHIAHRNWESDTDVISSGANPTDCPDLAQQLIDNLAGQGMSVIMGGGRRKFLPSNINDISGLPGQRSDGRHLINEWIAQKSGAGVYVTDKAGLAAVDPDDTEYLMGLFGYDHLDHQAQAPVDQPTLVEMVDKAIKVLDNEHGYFLFVENGHIDFAHHATETVKVLDETVILAEAVQRAVELTDSDDTLIVVSADHAHVMTINGYPTRGHDILGFAYTSDDGKPFATLSYANGPEGFKQDPITGDRYDITNDDLSDKDYLYPAHVPVFMESHGGDDVAVFCKGPWAHLCDGMYEQNLIPHIMAYAACVGTGATSCDCPSTSTTTTSTNPTPSTTTPTTPPTTTRKPHKTFPTGTGPTTTRPSRTPPTLAH